MTFNNEIEKFIKEYLKEIEENNAAVFAGAGLSAASGHVDWKGLLRDFAADLSLDITKETDLVTLVQYHLNKNANNRYLLNQKLMDEFHHGKKPNGNHEILARLPISTFWTTNYDKLIETALNNAGKITDVKYTTPQLARTVHGREAIVYKMHGDVEHPENSILSKDDYEKYFSTHGSYINALSGDLISKTFLFIGFSFTDPNLDYVLSRIRISFRENQRRHYCIFREIKKENNDTDKDVEYKKIKQALAIQDLLRFNIQVLIVKEYPDITSILREIENRFRRKTIYISGSAHEYGKWSAESAEKLITGLSSLLIRENFNIVSGFGLGVGSYVINGVLTEVYLNENRKLKNELMLRPFPQGEKGKLQWENYRKDMISYSGISLFLFGNKLVEAKVLDADGVRSEFEIAANQGSLVVPVGATGYIAEELWHRVMSDYEKYFGTKNFQDEFKELNMADHTPETLITAVVNFLKLNTKQ